MTTELRDRDYKSFDRLYPCFTSLAHYWLAASRQEIRLWPWFYYQGTAVYDAELSERRGARQVQGRVDRDKPIKLLHPLSHLPPLLLIIFHPFFLSIWQLVSVAFLLSRASFFLPSSSFRPFSLLLRLAHMRLSSLILFHSSCPLACLVVTYFA